MISMETMASADSASLVELEQACDGWVRMAFDLVAVNGWIGTEDLRKACDCFVEALEVDCQLAARWAS